MPKTGATSIDPFIGSGAPGRRGTNRVGDKTLQFVDVNDHNSNIGHRYSPSPITDSGAHDAQTADEQSVMSFLRGQNAVRAPSAFLDRFVARILDS